MREEGQMEMSADISRLLGRNMSRIIRVEKRRRKEIE